MEKYTKVKAIGKGNMGTCTLARNNEDGQCYVIKQVDLARLSKKERQQSLNEARVLSSLRHPNIINYVDSFLARKSDSLCIVMEFADGGDVNSRLRKNYGVNVAERQVLDWFIQLALSLQYVHQRKILHRDVKTQNIFLTSDSLIKLGDFGIARTLDSTYDQAKTFVGTPYYLSPELILERPYDHRSDVWALGVVLYELMALKPPFNAKDMKGLLQRILAVQYDPLPSIYSAELRDLVACILVRQPSERMELADVLQLPFIQERLRQWLTDTEVMPSHYVRALCKHQLLPQNILAEAGADAVLRAPSSLTVSEAAVAAAAASTVKEKERRDSSSTASSHADPQLPPLHPVPGAAPMASPNGRYAAPSTVAVKLSTRNSLLDRVRPPYVPPFKPYLPSALPAVSAPQSVARPLPALSQHWQGRQLPQPPPQSTAQPPTFSPATMSPSHALPPAPHSDRPCNRKRSEAARQSSVASPPSVPASDRSRKVARLATRPYVAQSCVSASPYIGDTPSGGAALPSLYPPLPMSSRKYPAVGGRRSNQRKVSPVHLNPLYRPPQPHVTPRYGQLAAPAAAPLDIKAMLHRATLERARRRPELN